MASYTSETITETVVTCNTKLRHLKLKPWNKIVDVLSTGNRWLEVASKVKRPDKETEFLYSAADIRKLEDQIKRGISPAEAFLEHWSTSGSKQPTVGDLLNILIDARLYQAADSVSQDLLKVTNSLPEDCDVMTGEILPDLHKANPEISIGIKCTDNASAEFDDTTAEVQNTQNTQQASSEPNLILPNFNDALELNNAHCQKPVQRVIVSSCILNYRYKHLAEVTGNFCDISVYHGGFKIGEGAFGIVYRAYSQGKWIAIKKMKEVIDKQFFTELEILSQYKHENLLPLLGYSNDGPYCCIVYLFMPNGSLQERLACFGNSVPITWTSRFLIACGTARGINHLHTFGSQPLVHRDIKSANVLLDENLVPKVGDFGLARVGNSGMTSSVAFTSNVYGTSVYMAREAFNGEVTIKLDTFSYGVVLLELLTGLPPYDASREETDLISHVEENCENTEDVVNILDTKGGSWNQEFAISLYKISKQCIETRKKDRPTIAQVLPEIEKLSSDCLNN